MNRSIRAALLGVGAAVVLGPAAVAARPVTLHFATVVSPYAFVNIQIHHPWAERVNAAGRGVLRIDVEDGGRGADFANVFRRVRADDVQIGWAQLPFASDAFPLSDVVSLPLLAPNAEHASVALYRLWKSGALDSEYRDIHPLKLCATAESGIHLREAPSSNEGLQGLRLIGPGRIGGDTIAALGATPVSLRLDEYRSALLKGAADGVMAGWTLFEPLDLDEVTTFHVEVAMGGAPCMVFMAKKRYLALPDAVRKVLAGRTREHESRMLGRFWDADAKEGRIVVRADKGHQVVAPSPGQLDNFRKRVAPAIAAWVRRTPGGAAILAKYRAILADLASEK